MMYLSTNRIASPETLREAVIRGIAGDGGLFVPERIQALPSAFIENMHKLSFQEIAYEVAVSFFGDDMPARVIKEIVYDALDFGFPLIQVSRNIYSLELFHGPTLAFKDVGARFMARMLAYFLKEHKNGDVNVLVATSGDTGGAVANGFLGVPGIQVYVLYPKGQVSEIQEKQFTTLGRNVTALEIDGTFDDCQRLVKQAFMDEELRSSLMLTSANSINVARFLPQAFYYFHAYACLKEREVAGDVVFSVPSGNLGNLAAGLVAKRAGLPASRFLAGNNANDILFQYLNTGRYEPRPSVKTIANAMDVGDPSNFARILYLYDNSYEAVRKELTGFRYYDNDIRAVMAKVYAESGYLLDPHGAVAYQALADGLNEGEVGVFLETAHPAKFLDTVEAVVGEGNVPLPDKLAAFMDATVQSVPLGRAFEELKAFLLGR